MKVYLDLCGSDLGFKDLLVTSDGEKIAHPHELQLYEKRLAQAQRGINRNGDTKYIEVSSRIPLEPVLPAAL